MIPGVVFASMAIILISQAVIMGAFSLIRHAMQTGNLTRLTIIYTAAKHLGQIYIPCMNWMQMIAAIVLLLGFQTSSRLAQPPASL